VTKGIGPWRTRRVTGWRCWRSW